VRSETACGCLFRRRGRGSTRGDELQCSGTRARLCARLTGASWVVAEARLWWEGDRRPASARISPSSPSRFPTSTTARISTSARLTRVPSWESPATNAVDVRSPGNGAETILAQRVALSGPGIAQGGGGQRMMVNGGGPGPGGAPPQRGGGGAPPGPHTIPPSHPSHPQHGAWLYSQGLPPPLPQHLPQQQQQDPNRPPPNYNAGPPPPPHPHQQPGGAPGPPVRVNTGFGAPPPPPQQPGIHSSPLALPLRLIPLANNGPRPPPPQAGGSYPGPHPPDRGHGPPLPPPLPAQYRPQSLSSGQPIDGVPRGPPVMRVAAPGGARADAMLGAQLAALG
jgi:hypothetical protein